MRLFQGFAVVAAALCIFASTVDACTASNTMRVAERTFEDSNVFNNARDAVLTGIMNDPANNWQRQESLYAAIGTLIYEAHDADGILVFSESDWSFDLSNLNTVSDAVAFLTADSSKPVSHAGGTTVRDHAITHGWEAELDLDLILDQNQGTSGGTTGGGTTSPPPPPPSWDDHAG
jgi:hypothetical protein